LRSEQTSVSEATSRDDFLASSAIAVGADREGNVGIVKALNAEFE
jgi:hypothetical protein